MTASFSLLLGIRLRLYTWLKGLVHRCLYTSISNLVDERLSLSQCELHSLSNLPPTYPSFPVTPPLSQRVCSLFTFLSQKLDESLLPLSTSEVNVYVYVSVCLMVSSFSLLSFPAHKKISEWILAWGYHPTNTRRQNAAGGSSGRLLLQDGSLYSTEERKREESE